MESRANLGRTDLYLHRELSMLEFNARVLAMAEDPEVPLLERVRFLAICSANLDEFFEIRVSGLRQLAERGLPRTEPDGLTALESLKRISARTHELVAQQYRLLNEDLLPALAVQGIHLHRRDRWDRGITRWARKYFIHEVLPVLTPIGLDPAHPFPRILNKSLNFVVTVEGTDAFGRGAGVAVVQVPRSLPRVIRLPNHLAKGTHDFVMLSSIIHANIAELFPGMKVTGCSQFRVTRNSDLWVDEEEVDDLMRALKGELPQRQFGDEVRLELAENCAVATAQFLLEKFGLGPDDLYFCGGPVNLNRLSVLHQLVDRPDLKYSSFIPRVALPIERARDPFDVLRKTDVLLHHPFDSFAPVVDLIRHAAQDPKVLAIKQTLYRTGADSPIVAALIEAARLGKEVTVLVELRARFDEAENIDLATRLQEAGAKVAYGIVGFKTHCKMLLIVRREKGRLRHYVHLGTGNYHHKTATAYTDIGFLTCDREIGDDIHKLFNQLTGLGRVRNLKKVIQSPFSLHRTLLSLIRREAELARQGRKAFIVARMNALTDPRTIQALYRASQAGVEIDLIVRGVCCLRPGIKGVSERIRVRSIVGRFLEHSRIFLFHADGEDLVYAASADWMQRNLSWRVETCFPIEDPHLKQQLIAETLDLYRADNTQAWLLKDDGRYRRLTPGAARPVSAQATLLENICGSIERKLKPQRLEKLRLGLESRAGERVVVEPALGKGDPEPVVPEGANADGRDRPAAPAAVEPGGNPEQRN